MLPASFFLGSWNRLKGHLPNFRPTDPFRLALWISLVATVCHVLSLHLEINFDGNWYIRLADILGTKEFAGGWDFLRGPLYPAALKFMFWLCGRQAMSVIGLQACIAFAAIYLLSNRIRSLGLRWEAAISMLLLSLYPTLIVYEHAVFTEVGTFFFLSIIVSLLTRDQPPTLAGAAALCLALSAGYYFRSSLLYLAPLAAILYALPTLRTYANAHWRVDRTPLLQILAITATVGIAPFLVAYPWQRNPMVSTRTGQSVILFGLIKSAVMPPDDPILGQSAPVYRKAIKDSLHNGKFPAHGLENGWEWPSMSNIYGLGADAFPIFIRVVRTHPLRYLAGVGRNILLVTGLSGFDNDNAVTRDRVLFPDGAQIDPGPSWLPPLGPEWKRTIVVSFTSRLLLKKLDRYYNWLLVFAFFATALTLILALLRLDRILLAFTAIPVVFLLIHVAFLMSEDRMALPAYPLILLNAVLLPSSIKHLRIATKERTLIQEFAALE